MALGGCLYIAPVVSEPVNTAPDILDPPEWDDNPNGRFLRLLINPNVNTLKVVATDADGDELRVSWNVPIAHDTRVAEDDDNTTFFVDLPRDEILDGNVISATIWDVRPVPEEVQVRFLLEVP